MKKYKVYQPTIWFDEPDVLIGVYDTEEEAVAQKNAFWFDLGRYIVIEDSDDEK